jgi:hypothetical protein
MRNQPSMRYIKMRMGVHLGTVPQSITSLSIFFSDCGVMKKSHNLLTSLGFSIIDDVQIKKSNSLLMGTFQTSSISSGNLVIKLISDPFFTKIRKSIGKRSSFAQVIDINKSFGSPLKGESTSSMKNSKLASGFYPFTALLSSFPFFVPSLTMDMRNGEATSQNLQDGNLTPESMHLQTEKIAFFSHIKEIIIPCSTNSYESIEKVQSALTESFGANPISSKMPGLYHIDLESNDNTTDGNNDKKKLIFRTAPSNVTTIILKVNDLEVAAAALKAMGALGDCMGYNGMSGNQQIQISVPGLERGLAFYTEPPQAITEDIMPEMQSDRVLIEGRGIGGPIKYVEHLNPLTLKGPVGGDCWKEVRVNLRNLSK